MKYSDMLNLNLPKPYTTRIRNALDASATSVNLRNLGGGGGAFYAGGIRLEALCVGVGYSLVVSRARRQLTRAEFRRIVDETLAPTLNEAFKTRVIEVMDQSQHTSADAGGEGAAYEFCQSLDSWERECQCVLSFHSDK
jgi:GINS complex subunit 3